MSKKRLTDKHVVLIALNAAVEWQTDLLDAYHATETSDPEANPDFADYIRREQKVLRRIKEVREKYFEGRGPSFRELMDQMQEEGESVPLYEVREKLETQRRSDDETSR